jgi:hypothetical protein
MHFVLTALDSYSERRHRAPLPEGAIAPIEDIPIGTITQTLYLKRREHAEKAASQSSE